MIKIYAGYIRYNDEDKEEDRDISTYGLNLVGEDFEGPLSRAIEDDIDEHGHWLTVRYYITESKMTLEEAEEQFVRVLFGRGHADYGPRYSAITGYLWTDDKMNVGGHNLEMELRSHLGKYCILQIEYNKAHPSGLLPGTQIAYIPDHASGDINHPDVEFGFVTILPKNREGVFCRYWFRGHPGELRTVANSELTPWRLLVRHDSVPQYVVEDLLTKLY